MPDVGFHHDVEGSPVVSNVRAEQRLDATKLVDITYDLAGEPEHYFHAALVVSQDGGLSFPLEVAEVSGAVGPGQTPGEGREIQWNPAVDLPGRGKGQLLVRIVIQGSLYSESETFEVVPATPGSLSGTVYNRGGEELEGAPVAVAGQEQVTGPDGGFEFETVPAGQVHLVVVRSGYYPSSEEVVIFEDSAGEAHVHLIPKLGSFGIVKVTSDFVPAVHDSTHGKAVYYLQEVNYTDTFRATVDWAGHEPGFIRWITPEAKKTVRGPKCPGSSAWALGATRCGRATSTTAAFFES